MPLDNMFANHLGARGGNFEPQRANNCLLEIIGLNTVSQGVGVGTGGDDDILTLSLRSFPIPKRTMGIVEIPYLNEKRKFAGMPTYDDLQVVYNDFVDRDVHAVIQKWNYLVHNPENGRTGLAARYKMGGRVRMVSPDGQIEREYELIGVWPSSFDPGDADMDTEDALRITMTLTIDKAIPRRGLAPSGTQA